MTNLTDQFRAARRVSTPIIAVRSADVFRTVRDITSTWNGDAPPAFLWDCARGLQSISEQGAAAIAQIDPRPSELLAPAALVNRAAPKLPVDGVVFAMNLHRFIDQPVVAQGLQVLRDEYRPTHRTFVIVSPDLTVPAELRNDVLILDDELPDQEQLGAIVRNIYSDAALPAPSDDVVAETVAAVTGLPAFAADQTVALALTRHGVDTERAWERKRAVIEQSGGLTVTRDGRSFDDVRGLEALKAFLRNEIDGRRPPAVILFIDEIEKMTAGARSNSDGGVSQGQIGTFLKWSEDRSARGVILLGPAGVGKSAIAKAMGRQAARPTISLDLTAMKASLVGESEAKLRSALQTIDAIACGAVYMIATCNRIQDLSPELRRRFRRGIWFVDLPTADERADIWRLYAQKFGLPEQPIPSDQGWTGAEIENCCELAYEQQITLLQSARYVIPLAVSSKDVVAALREEASGGYLDASLGGAYSRERAEHATAMSPTQAPAARQIELPD